MFYSVFQMNNSIVKFAYLIKLWIFNDAQLPLKIWCFLYEKQANFFDDKK